MDDVWDLLKEYDFLLTNIINIDFVCILCKKVLIDPRIGPCGCKFCKICIEDYLKNGDNICPGSTDECKEEYLNLIENINIDHFLNRKIAKLKINCPIESCTFSDQIINMKQHLIVCREFAIKCGFSENGCDFISLSGDNVDKHCKMSKDKHLELVLLRMENMKNINNLLNINKIEFKQEIDKLKIENDNDKNKLKQNEINFNQLKQENQIQTKQIDDYKTKYENEMKNKNNLIKIFSEYLLGNSTEFIWKIDKISEMKNSVDKTKKSDKFFIFKEDISMQLTMCYDTCCKPCKYMLRGSASHHNKLFNDLYPIICNISIAILNKIGGHFIFSCDEKVTFNIAGITFDKEIPVDQIINDINNDCLIVRCVIKLSL